MEETSFVVVTVCGAPESGKTSLIKRFIENTFTEDKQESYTDPVCFSFSYF